MSSWTYDLEINGMGRPPELRDFSSSRLLDFVNFDAGRILSMTRRSNVVAFELGHQKCESRRFAASHENTMIGFVEDERGVSVKVAQRPNRKNRPFFPVDHADG